MASKAIASVAMGVASGRATHSAQVATTFTGFPGLAGMSAQCDDATDAIVGTAAIASHPPPSRTTIPMAISAASKCRI